jgi:PAS domain S-box-containing protein
VRDFAGAREVARVLVCEDERVIAEDVAATLCSFGYDVVGTVDNAEDLAQMVRFSRPDLILMDIRLQGEEDGIAAIERIRTMCDIPVVYLTACTDKEILERAKKTQPYGYLEKPVSRVELKSAIEIALYRHAADRRVRRSEERLKSILDGMHDYVFVMSKEGLFTDYYHPPHLGPMLYLPPDAFVGRHFEDVLPQDTAERLAQVIALVEQTGFVQEFDYSLTVDGEPGWFCAKVSGRKDASGNFEGVTIVVRDITERKRVEEKLRKSDEKYRQLVENLNVGVFTCNLEGAFLYANPAMANIGGYDDVEDFMSFPTYRLYADITERPKLLADLTEKGFVKDRELRYLKKDGTICWLSLSAVLQRDENGDLCLISGIVEDVSERKRLAEALIQSEKHRAVADVTAGVAHNFNNLLQVVMGNADVALRRLPTGDLAKVKVNLDRIMASAGVGAETVKGLSRYARSRQEGRKPEHGVFDLADVVTEAEAFAGPWLLSRAEGQGREITLDARLQKGTTIRGDRTEIFEVVVNLVKNSVDAMPNGGVIRIETQVNGTDAMLRVRDTGTGIPEADLNRLFTPFYTTKLDVGRGLGLALCKRIIDAHDGVVHVESVEGEGTLFTITFPYAPEEPGRARGETNPTQTALRVLAVDDADATVELLQAGLGMLGHSVRTASLGEAALDILRKSPVDVVICDLGMPGMNGRQVAAAVQEMVSRKEIRKPGFIILTGWDDQGLEGDKLASMGVDAVVRKPVDMDELSRVAGAVFAMNCARLGDA